MSAAVKRTRRAVPIAVAIVVGVVALDQLTKIWAVESLAHRTVSVIGSTVELQLARNSGGAFSVLRGGGFTPILALLAVGVAVFLVRLLRRTDDVWMVVALSFVLGGALGNLTDRFARAPGFLRGEVIDFVKVGWWPTFNVADSALTVGLVLLVALSFRRQQPELR